MVKISTLKVGIEDQSRLICLCIRVEWHDLPLGISDRGGLRTATTSLSGIDGSLEIRSRGKRTLLYYPISSTRVTPIILRISVLHIRRCSDETMHPLDLPWVLRQVSLVFTSKYDVLVVRPSNLLIRQEIVASLLLLSLNLLLESGSYVSEALLTDTALATQTLSRLGALIITMIHHFTRIGRIHDISIIVLF